MNIKVMNPSYSNHIFCHSLALKFEFRNNEIQFEILDQTLLPNEEVWLSVLSTDILVDSIKCLKIRGAPLIGIAASLQIASLALQNKSIIEISADLEKLYESRPTAVNLMNCLNRLKNLLKKESLSNVIQECVQIFNEDVELCEHIAKTGLSVIQSNERILTHCNTGGLATAGVGTALGIIRKSQSLYNNLHIYADETRPLLQGARLTAWELKKFDIPFELITDNMAADLMKKGLITKVIVGADRVAKNGDFANKIGTYSVAVLAHYHKIPFYVAAPMTTFDLNCETGDQIHIEQRNPSEVQGFVSSKYNFSWTPKNTPIYNPSFDVTPSHLVTGWITPQKIYTQDDFKKGLI